MSVHARGTRFRGVAARIRTASPLLEGDVMRFSFSLSSLLVAASLAFTGCAAHVYTTALNPAPGPMSAREPAQVELFSSGPPTRPHVDVAVYQAEPGIDESTTGTLISRMRERAASEGCDGLVITQVANQQIKNEDRVTVTGTCIVYTAPDAGLETAAAQPASSNLPPPPVTAAH
jgi:hypothetical protein